MKKLVQQFTGSMHKKMFATDVFNIHQGPSEYLREYLTQFTEEKIKVIHPNFYIFIEPF